MQGTDCSDMGGPKAKMGGNRHQELDSDKETVSGGVWCWGAGKKTIAGRKDGERPEDHSSRCSGSRLPRGR